MSEQTITLGGGCFWCTESIFDRVRGIIDVQSGYTNGQVKNPSYEQVCTGRTGHAEVVRLVFDDQQISLRQVLEIFFATHDPTTLNRQGNDVGTQYRSGIYVNNAEQQKEAQSVVDELSRLNPWGSPITTEIAMLDNYSAAEDYHQDYFANHPEQGYCQFVVRAKVEKFSKTFKAFLKD